MLVISWLTALVVFSEPAPQAQKLLLHFADMSDAPWLTTAEIPKWDFAWAPNVTRSLGVAYRIHFTFSPQPSDAHVARQREQVGWPLISVLISAAASLRFTLLPAARRAVAVAA